MRVGGSGGHPLNDSQTVGFTVVGRSFDKKIRRFSMQNLWFYCGERMGVGLEILLNHCSFGSHKS